MSETFQELRKLKALSEMIRDLQIRSEERLKAQHGHFNVFTTLLSAGDEVRLHTRFLHELLNPAGTHDCGNLFLKLFFETLKDQTPVCHNEELSKENWDEYAAPSYWVGKEVRKKQGQLDLLLEADSRVLVIENKIWAVEGDRQVARYAEYLESQKKKTGLVLFLTLDGKASVTNEGQDYLRISYREHILDWLDRCLRATYDKIPINQALIQYRNVVRQLTGMDIESQNMNEITEFVRKNPEIITQVAKIDAAVKELRFEAVDLFFAELGAALRQHYEVKPRPGMMATKELYPGLVIHVPNDPVLDTLPGEMWIELNPWDALFIGLETKWQKVTKLSPDMTLHLSEVAKKIWRRSEEDEYHHATLSETWIGTHWPLGGHDLKTLGFSRPAEATQRLLDPAERKRMIAEVMDDISIYFNYLREAIQDSQSVSQSR